MASQSFRIADKMVKYPYTVEKSEPLLSAGEFMRKCSIRHLPVVDGESLVGIISDRDIRSVLHTDYSALMTVGDIMNENIYLVDKTALLSDVLETMAACKYGSAIVKDATHNVLGIFTTTDALKMLAKMLKEQDEKELQHYLQDIDNSMYAEFA